MNDKIEKKEYSIIIPNNFVQENKYNSETVFIYGLLQKLLNYRGYIVFNLTWLFEQLRVDKNNTTSRKRIKETLLTLEKDGYIKFNCDLNKINKNKLIFAEMIYIEDQYCKIFDYEFDIIHRYNKADIYKLFCVFANIKSRSNYNGHCFPSYARIEQDTGINSNTSIAEYLKILKDELKLILYDNPGMGIVKNSNGNIIVKQLNNIYVMNYEGYDEMLKELIEFRKNQLAGYYDKIVKDDDVNGKRSESMKKYWKDVKDKKEEGDREEDVGLDDLFNEKIIYDED